MSARKLGLTAAVLALLTGVAIGPGGASALVGDTDLALTKSDSADPVTQGNNFTYTIKVQNLGTMDAGGVIVTDKLPGQVDYVSSTTSAGSCSNTNDTVTCSLGQVDAGVTVTATITVKANKSGTASNTASLASVNDTVAANNQDTESTTISKKPSTKKGKNKKQAASCAAPTISGTPGNDKLVGTAGGDVIRGFAGSDQIFGGGGPDLICANRGADLIIGGSDSDSVSGGPGPDRLYGGTEGDVLRGNTGRDRLRGQRGGDLLNGGRSRDNCKGGADADTLRRCP